MTAVDVEPLAGAAPRAREPLGVEQVEELLAATLLVHQVEDREVHEVGSEEMIVETREPGEQIRTWLKRANHQIGYMSQDSSAQRSVGRG